MIRRRQHAELYGDIIPRRGDRGKNKYGVFEGQKEEWSVRSTVSEGKAARGEVGEGHRGHVTWGFGGQSKEFGFYSNWNRMAKGSHLQILNRRAIWSDLRIPCVVDPFTWTPANNFEPSSAIRELQTTHSKSNWPDVLSSLVESWSQRSRNHHNLKLSKRCEQTFHKRRYMNGQ